jgi:hypothetical protein
MSAPMFIHIQKNGDVWVTNNQDDTVAGSVNAAIFRVNSGAAFQKVGTIAGTTPNMTASNGTGKNGKEIW